MEPKAPGPASYRLTACDSDRYGAGVEHEAEYAGFVAERWSALVRAAVFLGAASHEAEDLVQATLLLCYRKVGPGAGRGRPGGVRLPDAAQRAALGPAQCLVAEPFQKPGDRGADRRGCCGCG